MQKVTPFLWFDNQAEEAAKFYCSIFPGATCDEGMNGPDGNVLVISFNLCGTLFTGLNGGPMYKFSPATSFVVRCESQAEVDHFWSRLSEGGKLSQCGWLDDKFGVTWQIVPNRFFELLNMGTPAQTGAVMGAMMQMVKFDIAALEAAFEGAAS